MVGHCELSISGGRWELQRDIGNLWPLKIERGGVRKRKKDIKKEKMVGLGERNREKEDRKMKKRRRMKDLKM